MKKRNVKLLVSTLVILSTAIIFMVLGNVFHEVRPPESRQQKKGRQNIPTPQNKATLTFKGIFIPYWAPDISSNPPYNSYYYFGVQPTREGKIDREEAGFKNLPLTQHIPTKKKELVLRMLDATVTESIMNDKTALQTLISGVRKLLSEYEFSGLILDIEVPFTLQVNKKEQINNIVQQICTDIHTDYKTCSILIYGDFAYRNRPYDLKKLGMATDKILLMAYDFHKAAGEPGPNFPFDSGLTKSPSLRTSPPTSNYGYDFKQMVSDAIALIPKEKIEVVFGMYGYDWALNDQGTPIRVATARTLKEIQADISQDKFKISHESQVSASREKNIRFVGSDGLNHVIWYEDEESVDVKTKYLQELGIYQVSFWAQSYF